MEMELASPNEKEKMQMRQYQAQAAPLAQQEKGMVGQMGDMAKRRAMEGALDAGQEGIMKGIGSLAGPSAAQTAGLQALAPAAGGLSPGASMAVMGNAGMAGTTGAGLAGAGGMAALGTAIPYVGAGFLAGKALGLFNQGGQVGPLSAQYNAQGTMTEEQARALMMNQPEPQASPMVNPDELYNEIIAEQVRPKPRPSANEMYLYNNPNDASMIYEGYDAILPPYTEDLPQYKAGGGPLGLGLINMYQDMMKKNLR